MSEWKAVPVEPTKEMIRAAADYIAGNPTTAQLQPSKRRTLGETLAFEHKAMLAAAPDTHVAVERATVKKAREAFEASGLMKPHCYRRHPEGDYRELATQFHWRAWLAAYKSLGVIKEGEE